MKIEFGNLPDNCSLIVLAEDQDEASKLQRWDNCIVTSRFDPDYDGNPALRTLYLVKEL